MKRETWWGRTQCRELPLCAESREGCQWQALPSPVQCEETTTRTRDLPVTGGKTLPLAPDPPFNCFSFIWNKKMADLITNVIIFGSWGVLIHEYMIHTSPAWNERNNEASTRSLFPWLHIYLLVSYACQAFKVHLSLWDFTSIYSFILFVLLGLRLTYEWLYMQCENCSCVWWITN